MAKSKKQAAGLEIDLKHLKQYKAEVSSCVVKMRGDIEAGMEFTPSLPTGNAPEGVRAYFDKLYREHADLCHEDYRVECEIQKRESWLHPQKGRSPGSRSKQPKPLDTAIAAAILKWPAVAARLESKKQPSERQIAGRVSFEMLPNSTREERANFAARLRKEWRKRKPSQG
jgi:hypothetical protein